MATVGTFNVALMVSATRFTSGLAKAERQWNSFARRVQRDSKTLPKAISSVTPAALTLAKTVVKVGAIAGVALSGIGAAGVKLAADFEQTNIAFTTLLGSAEKAKSFLGDLVEFAARTPFQFTGLAQASRQLLAYGFAAKQVLPTLQSIGDAVSALGGGQAEIQRAVLALGQMRAKGKVAGEEMRQLTELGIPAWEMLAKSIGVSIPEAMKLVEKRAISASTGIAAILQGINRRFAGAMDVQSRTLLGRLSTLRDNIEIILRGLGQDLIRIFGLKEAIDNLTKAVSRFAAIVTEHGFVTALARAFPPWLRPVIIGIAGAIGGALVPVIITALIPALKKLAVSLWATLAPLWPWMVAGAAVALVAWVLARNWNRLGEIGRRVWMGLSGIVLYAASIIVHAVGGIITALSWIVPGLRDTAQSVIGYANSLKSAAQQAFEAARATSEVSQGAQDAANTGQQAADAQEGLGDALEETAQKAQDNIQSFDEVHQIQDEMADTEIDLSDIMAPDIPMPPALNIPGAIGSGMDEMGNKFTGLGDRMVGAFERIKQAMEPVSQLARQIGDNLDKIAAVGLTISLYWVFKLTQPFWPAFAAFMAAHALPVSIALATIALLVALEWKFKLLEKFKEAFEKWKAGLKIPEWLPIGALAIGLTAILAFSLSEPVIDAFNKWAGGVIPEGFWRTSWLMVTVYLMFKLARNIWESIETWAKDNIPEGFWRTSWVTITIYAAFKLFRDIWESFKAWADNNVPEGFWRTSWLTVTIYTAFEFAKNIWQAFQEWWAEHAPSADALQRWIESLGPLSVFVLLDLSVRALKTWVQAFQEWWAKNAPNPTEITRLAEALAPIPLFAPVLLAIHALNTWREAFDKWWAEHKPNVAELQAWIEGLGAISIAALLALGFKHINDWLNALSRWWAEHAPSKEQLQAWLDALAPLSLAAVIALGLKHLNDWLTALKNWWKDHAPSKEKLQAWLDALQPITLALKIAFTFVVDTFKQIGDIFNQAGIKVKQGWEKILQGVSDKWEQAKTSIPQKVSGMAQDIIKSFQGMGVTIPTTVATLIATILIQFKNLADQLVTHSIVPDMVNAIGSWFGVMKDSVTKITTNMWSSIMGAFSQYASNTLNQFGVFGYSITSMSAQIGSGIQGAFERAFDGILSGSMTFSQAMGSILGDMGQVVRNLLVQQLAQAAQQSLVSLGQWVWGVIAKAGAAIIAFIQQAYAALVAFFWWLGPGAPFAAAGVIGAAILGLGTLAAKALGAFRGAVGLAEGGIVTGPTFAQLGEGGKREAVVPLERDNVLADSIGQAVYEAMLTAARVTQASGEPGAGNREVVLKLDGAVIARAILPPIIREGQRQGLQLVVQSRGV